MPTLLASFFQNGKHVIPANLPDEAFLRYLAEVEAGIV